MSNSKYPSSAEIDQWTNEWLKSPERQSMTMIMHFIERASDWARTNPPPCEPTRVNEDGSAYEEDGSERRAFEAAFKGLPEQLEYDPATDRYLDIHTHCAWYGWMLHTEAQRSA